MRGGGLRRCDGRNSAVSRCAFLNDVSSAPHPKTDSTVRRNQAKPNQSPTGSPRKTYPMTPNEDARPEKHVPQLSL